MSKVFRSLTTGGVAAVSVAAILLGAAGPAAALGKNGNLEVDEFGLFYNQNQAGCVFDLYGEDLNFNNDYFKSGCTGGTSLVNDNTESYRNRDVYAWKVATDANIDGNVGEIPSGYSGNASTNFKNKISSATFTLHP
ncbi:hypothetical protein ACFVZ8_17245 [Streptomyces sp. NPDC059558]|uniref:Beta/gamma crystallin 'Greek key' domain-containing protein n=1 Tax=Streptomyces virginiae TaxID=1961 RepID=A0A0L8M5N6_STRVG|nr:MULTISPECIES: hypothetical protein [Streptomyces]ARE75185.1 hypothetical protein B6R96_15450 [Streptomyces sp. Sge12]KOG45696.1 hypothetical protein ADK75_30510 [Streptomyces virginiae]